MRPHRGSAIGSTGIISSLQGRIAITPRNGQAGLARRRLCMSSSLVRARAVDHRGNGPEQQDQVVP